MPWDSNGANTHVLLKNKSIELRQLFASHANAALAKGRTTEESDYSGLSAVKLAERKQQQLVKQNRPKAVVPEHLQAVLDLLNVTKGNGNSLKQPQEPLGSPTSDDSTAGNTNVASDRLNVAMMLKNALPADPNRSLISADFDADGRLVLRFDTGETITTTEGNIREYIERIVTIATPSNTGGGGGGDLPTSINSPQTGEVLVYNSDLAAWENKLPEDIEVQAKRVDFVGEDVIYKAEAAVGTLNSQAFWRIRKITIAVDGDVTETWASSNANYDKVWNDHLSYTYV